MSAYEQMWKGLVERLVLANRYTIRKEISYQDVINIMAVYEEHFKEELEVLDKEEEDKQIKEELELDPLQS